MATLWKSLRLVTTEHDRSVLRSDDCGGMDWGMGIWKNGMMKKICCKNLGCFHNGFTAHLWAMDALREESGYGEKILARVECRGESLLGEKWSEMRVVKTYKWQEKNEKEFQDFCERNSASSSQSLWLQEYVKTLKRLKLKVEEPFELTIDYGRPMIPMSAEVL